MTGFELGYLLCEPALPPLYRQVRRKLYALAERVRRPIDVLDVGGRKSHYTIGLRAAITVSDIPRTTTVQRSLNLGLTDAMTAELQRRRSNVRAVVIDDMTRSRLPSASFDIVVAVEVLEHVEEDDAFVAGVARVLRPGGTFVMTTPNGDAVPIPSNEDHKRHYPAEGLRTLLARHFERVRVQYAVHNSAFRRAGLRSWSMRRPVQTVLSMAGNLVAGVESNRDSVARDRNGTRHLFAVCETMAQPALEHAGAIQARRV